MEGNLVLDSPCFRHRDIFGKNGARALSRFLCWGFDFVFLWGFAEFWILVDCFGLFLDSGFLVLVFWVL